MEDPTTRIRDPKRRAMTQGTLLVAGGKQLMKTQGDVDNARTALANLSEFDELNEQVRPSGGMINAASNWVKDALGSDKLARMDQISNAQARLMRQPGEGAVSDYEGKLFRKMVGGYNQPYATNVAYSKAAKALAQRTIDQQQFRESYLAANNSLVGVDKHWQHYRDNNPILDRKGNVIKTKSPAEWYSGRMQRVQDYGIDKKGQIRSAPPSTRKASSKGWSAREVK